MANETEFTDEDIKRAISQGDMLRTYKPTKPKVASIEVFGRSDNNHSWFERHCPNNDLFSSIKLGDTIEIQEKKYHVGGCGSSYFGPERTPTLLAFDGERTEWMEKDYPDPNYHNIDEIFKDYCPFD